MINHWETKLRSCKNKQYQGKSCRASVAQMLQVVTFNHTFKSHSITDQLWSHILVWCNTGMSLKFSGKCSCSICEASHALMFTVCTVYQQVGTDFCITQISSVFIVQLHATFSEKKQCSNTRSVVHQATEWMVVMLSESTQRCLPPRPLTSVEGYIRKVSEDEVEVFPNPWRCPHAILKKETKQKNHRSEAAWNCSFFFFLKTLAVPTPVKKSDCIPFSSEQGLHHAAWTFYISRA